MLHFVGEAATAALVLVVYVPIILQAPISIIPSPILIATGNTPRGETVYSTDLPGRVFDKAFWKSYTYFNLTMQGAAKQHERMYARLFKLWRKLPEQAERSR
ncbi:hypothetical protein ANACOL_02325 [Anaerotruncus colihominis DSM 17241]|uniref:Uncharacterized protein n=1 Tax=Anaerotruncus colihominis DSM 17241 TaxID=445972 RepID=B0PC16_9FIRM|nr:hypothetical protein ANACOL_02325 [Anaerotruncus colihominis DSM 17241]